MQETSKAEMTEEEEEEKEERGRRKRWTRRRGGRRGDSVKNAVFAERNSKLVVQEKEPKNCENAKFFERDI